MKTKFKKFIALGLCALMIFSSCAKKTGSGGDDNSGKEVTSEGLKSRNCCTGRKRLDGLLQESCW